MIERNASFNIRGVFSPLKQSIWSPDIFIVFQEDLSSTLEEEEELNENTSPFLNTPIPDAALHAARILKELGYENLAIYPGGKKYVSLVQSLQIK